MLLVRHLGMTPQWKVRRKPGGACWRGWISFFLAAFVLLIAPREINLGLCGPLAVRHTSRQVAVAGSPGTHRFLGAEESATHSVPCAIAADLFPLALFEVSDAFGIFIEDEPPMDLMLRANLWFRPPPSL